VSLTEIQMAVLKQALPDKDMVKSAASLLRDKVIRFREDSGYNDSFALQWTKFQLNQYDSTNGTTIYHDRYVRETGWPVDGLDGDLILEAGCGAGAFTCHLAKTGANLISFDYSAAVDVSAEHNDNGRVVFAQSDILDMPFADDVFDRIFCHGVLQHTPDPEQAFKALHKKLKPGGKLSIDIYHSDGKVRPWKSKYIWRPITTRMDQKKLMAFLEWFIPKWLPFDTVIKRIPHLANYLGAIIPCWNYHYTNLPKDQLVQWAIMDTFDALSPTFDKPTTMKNLKRWFQDCGFQDYEVREGGTGLVGNGVKPRKI
jgi:SAM-dependent methyltransferase